MSSLRCCMTEFFPRRTTYHNFIIATLYGVKDMDLNTYDTLIPCIQ